MNARGNPIPNPGLVAPSIGDSTASEAGRQSLELPVADGVGTLEVLDLPLGIRLTRSTLHVIREVDRIAIPAARPSQAARESGIVVVSVARGRVRVQCDGWLPSLSVGGGRDAFLHSTAPEVHVRVPASRLTSVTTLHVDVRALVEMLDEDFTHRFLAGLGISDDPSAHVVAVPPSIGTILHSGMNADVAGPMRKLKAHARVLEYISELGQHLVHSPYDPQQPSRRARALALRRELMTLSGTVPRLETLAANYGVSARALNEDFRQVHGQSIYSFFTDHRLSQAHAAVLGSDVPLKRIAAELGYSHVNHFSNAFRRKFGYPPGRLRKRA